MHTYYENLDLLVFRPTGIMDLAMVRGYYDLVAGLKPACCSRRLVDLVAIERIDFGYDELPSVERMAQTSRVCDKSQVKIALYATRPIAVGMANMIQRIISRPDYQISVVGNLEEAALYLDVPVTYLQEA